MDLIDRALNLKIKKDVVYQLVIELKYLDKPSL